MNHSGNSSDRNPGGLDDLQNIKGIGKSIAQALNELGILSYSDLAGYTPERLLDGLKGRVPAIALQRAHPEEWIRQARELSGRQPSHVEPEISTQQGQRAGRDWREIADFFVSFGYEIQTDGQEQLKTRAHHSQNDQNIEWDSVETEALLAWMLSQAGLIGAVEAAPAAHTAVEAAGEMPSGGMAVQEAVHLELSNLWVSEASLPAPANGQAQPGFLRLEGDLHLSGPDAESSTYDRLAYSLDIYIVDKMTNQSGLARSYEDRLQPGQLDYPIYQDFPIPPVGRYQLFVVARLLPPVAVATHIQGPIIEVEA